MKQKKWFFQRINKIDVAFFQKWPKKLEEDPN
jgi:hypothetical protein